LFDLPGAHEIAAEVIQGRTRIEAIITKFIAENNLNKTKADEFETDAWALIKTEPESSPILKAAVYDHVVDVIKRGPKTQPERDLTEYLAVYVQQSRKLAATEMQKVWESWIQGREALTASRGNNMVNAYDTGVAPPDMLDMIGDVMTLAPGAAIAMTFYGATTLEAMSPAVAELTAKFAMNILPYRFRDATAAAATAARTGTTAAASSASAGIGAFAGPLVILTATSILATMATDNALAQNKQEAIVNDALQVAQRPVNPQRLLLTDKGRTEVASNWALMTQELTKPQTRLWAKLLPEPQQKIDLGPIVIEGDAVVFEAANASGWAKMEGNATDVAIGSDGTIYAIGVTKVPGGFEIFKRAKTDKRWSKVKGAGTRIAVMDTQAWIINSAGNIFSLSGSKWARVPGPAAQDIGASPKGVWIIGKDEKIYQRVGNDWTPVSGAAQRIDIDQDGRPWVVSKQGDIYVHDNTLKWVKQPGSAVDVAADIPGQTLVIGKDGKVYVYNMAKKNWDPVSNHKDTQGIGAGGGQVWRLTTKNDMYLLQ